VVVALVVGFPMVARSDMLKQRKSDDHDVQQQQFPTVPGVLRISDRRIRRAIDRRPSSPRGLSLRIFSELSLRPGGLAGVMVVMHQSPQHPAGALTDGLVARSRNMLDRSRLRSTHAIPSRGGVVEWEVVSRMADTGY
jgi:hypothetical protein